MSSMLYDKCMTILLHSITLLWRILPFVHLSVPNVYWNLEGLHCVCVCGLLAPSSIFRDNGRQAQHQLLEPRICLGEEGRHVTVEQPRVQPLARLGTLNPSDAGRGIPL